MNPTSSPLSPCFLLLPSHLSEISETTQQCSRISWLYFSSNTCVEAELVPRTSGPRGCLPFPRRTNLQISDQSTRNHSVLDCVPPYNFWDVLRLITKTPTSARKGLESHSLRSCRDRWTELENQIQELTYWVWNTFVLLYMIITCNRNDNAIVKQPKKVPATETYSSTRPRHHSRRAKEIWKSSVQVITRSSGRRPDLSIKSVPKTVSGTWKIGLVRKLRSWDC